MKNHFLPVVMSALAAVALTACVPEPGAAPAKKTESVKAREAADSITFTENAEIENIKRRVELTSKPGAIGFIILLNEMGQPILYESVVGKVTSSGKRLTPPVQAWRIDRGEWDGTELGPSPSDEGTWGSSSPYIYYWNDRGEYRQWSGHYLYSDQPLRLTQEPLVVSVTEAPAD